MSLIYQFTRQYIDNKPVVNGRVGFPQYMFWDYVSQTTKWLLGTEESMRCMSYFPVIIKRQHLTDMREYIENLHRENFDCEI